MDRQSAGRRAKRLAVAVLAAGLLAGAGAGAQEPGQDEVTLKNGGTIRGTVVASEPGTSVKIIEMGQKEPRVIPWSQVSDVEKGKYAPKAPVQPGPAGPGYGVAPPQAPLPPPQAPEAPPPKLGDPGVIRLHIDSPRPARLVERASALVGTYGPYGVVLTAQRTVCTSPCDTVFDARPGHVFVLADDTFPSPGPIVFAGMKGDVTLHVQPGSFGQRIGGATAIVLGSLAAVGGAIALPLGLASTTTDLNTGVSVTVPDRTLRNTGIGLLVGGAAALAGGIALYVDGATKVDMEQRRSAAPRKEDKEEGRAPST
jgi:hypothetical protein